MIRRTIRNLALSHEDSHMPLINSSTPKAIGENIKTERAAGKPENQAVAIAESVAAHAKSHHKMAQEAMKPSAPVSVEQHAKMHEQMAKNSKGY